MPIVRTKNERFDSCGKDRAVAEVEGARARQRFVADYQTRVQHGAGGVLQLVPAGAAARLHFRGRGAHVRACPTARWTLVHCRSRRKARTRSDRADATWVKVAIDAWT